MGLLYIIMDGIEYRVPIEYQSLTRSFDFVDGGRGGMTQAGSDVLDTLGTKIGYSLHIPAQQRVPGDYDAFFEAISNPDRQHLLTLPYGQTELTFWAKVEGGSDVLQDVYQTYRRWGDLSVRFTPISPQRTPGVGWSNAVQT